MPACSDDAGCLADGAVCRDGQCVLPDDGGTFLADGASCSADAECASGICLPADRGGFCSRACVDATSCASAVSFSASCGPAVRDGVVGTYCLRAGSGALAGEACDDDASCRSRSCVGGICTEACDDATDCAYGLECSSVDYASGSFSGCRFPTGNEYEVTLPSYSLQAGFVSPGLRVALPSDVTSVTLYGQVTGGDALPISFYTVGHDGTVLFDLASLQEWEDPVNRWLPLDSYESIAMLVPNSTADRVVLRGTDVRMSVAALYRAEGDTGTAQVATSAFVRRGSDAGAGTLDVAIHMVGVGITAAEAPSNARVQAFVTRFGEMLQQSGVGISLGTVSYYDVSGASALSTIDSTTGPDSELAELFRLSSARSGRVLSLFLVRTLEGAGSGFNLLGVSGGIPGPSAVHGTMHSGVVVAFDPSVIGGGTDGARMAGQVAAHESSHFLGLFHTTEQLPACSGSDTPDTASCSPFGGGDPIADTAVGDASNLMNWAVVGSGSNTDLSAGQGYVLRRSRLVRW